MLLANDLEDLTCNICNKDYDSYLNLKIHSRQVHKEEPVSCEECGKELLNKWSLRGHIQYHEYETCKVCNEKMKKKSILKHMEKLENSIMKLHSDFKVPITPKLHIIFEHLPEYFELTGKTLRKKTDQTVEVTHAKLDKFIKAHNYQIRDVTSEKAGEFLLRAIKHFNSYNLGKLE